MATSPAASSTATAAGAEPQTQKRKLKLGFKHWHPYVRKVLFGLLVLELPMDIAILIFFGIADPDTYRDRLWLDGFQNGFNSSPSQPIFDLVNGGTMDVPLVWSAAVTQFNLVLSVLILFILLAKSVLAALKRLPPWFSLVIHIVELALVAFSLHAQTAPDTIDPQHENHGAPWYITRNCSVAKQRSNIGYCQQAKAAFYVIVFFVILYTVHILLCVHSIALPPPPKPVDEEEAYADYKNRYSDDEPQWEMVPIPQTPGTARTAAFPYPLSPTTPRTRAFNTLEGAFVKSQEADAYAAPEGKERKGFRRFLSP